MLAESSKLDRQARMLIQASELLLRDWLGVPRLDQALVGTLYLRQRSILERWHVVESCDDRSQKYLIEQLAVGIFLTAVAWQTAAQPDVNLLSSLRQIVSAGLPASESTSNWSEGEA